MLQQKRVAVTPVEANCHGFNVVTEVMKRVALGVELHVC